MQNKGISGKCPPTPPSTPPPPKKKFSFFPKGFSGLNKYDHMYIAYSRAELSTVQFD